MSIGSRIKECRERLGLTQTELAKMLDVSKGTIGNYEAEISTPKIELMTKLFEILQTDANYIFQDDFCRTPETFSLKESDMISKYRELDNYGKEAVDSILNVEYKRCASTESEPEINVTYSKIYTDDGVIKRETPANLPKISDFFDD